MARLACRGKQLRDELREQRARLLARAAPLEADVGALLSATVDAVAPAAARPRLRYLDERGHARLAVLEAEELRERRRRARPLCLNRQIFLESQLCECYSDEVPLRVDYATCQHD